jgi:hypothetical protein
MADQTAQQQELLDQITNTLASLSAFAAHLTPDDEDDQDYVQLELLNRVADRLDDIELSWAWAWMPT